jgi:hypothetical protein
VTPTRRSEVTLEWADGEYLFALRGKEIEELQAVCKAGFGTVYQRVMQGNWYIADIHNTIRLGLIGGGMGAIEAKRLCENYAVGLPLSAGPNSPLLVAQAILGATMMGVDEIKSKKTPPTPTLRVG